MKYGGFLWFSVVNGGDVQWCCGQWSEWLTLGDGSRCQQQGDLLVQVTMGTA